MYDVITCVKLQRHESCTLTCNDRHVQNSTIDIKTLKVIIVLKKKLKHFLKSKRISDGDRPSS